VLDVGCGFGQITEMLNLEGVEAIGIDIGGDTRENRVWKHLSSIFILGDGCNLPFGSNVFDNCYVAVS
jgi:SAM-dependent methyltransferase